MSYDLFTGRNTSSNWARPDAIPSPPVKTIPVRLAPGRPVVRVPLPAPFALPDTLNFDRGARRTLLTINPETAEFAVRLLGWARNQGFDAKITHTGVYTPEESREYSRTGKSLIAEGNLDWHNVGRAFHILLPPKSGTDDYAGYAKIAKQARAWGGDWLGDTELHDLSHYEYHPLWPGKKSLPTYRRDPIAPIEFAQAQHRLKTYRG